ncbi:flagellar hook-length control protein FliK [Halanaerobium praevalens]|uniref:Flagellar hook-length control protein-like, C-terminal domain protein n=1 Tax=Halanaerobium praevalens (strain ATCC 33744 / DSM 2228 / GSL) TaxID=572479 RepID=E3DPM8_HALPG|nr:flagellar hook-length control protein FliK [Halanaerobium praevalens]ADO76703.1 Flagellar hook-length control protein-like, C-terminal domain protein [Halanaerobium praevalens DSM 2228]
MTEMVFNNILESKSYDFKQASPKESTALKDGKSFAETMAEIKEQQKLKKVTKKNTKTEEKSTSLKNEDFLAKLKEIMKKNKKEIPAELMSLLQGGSLNNQQKAMLESLMLNLKNNKLNISDLKSLLAKNSESENDNLQVIESLNSVDAENEIELKDLDADSLEKLASFLADPEKNLSQANKSKLKSELDQLSSLLVNSNSELAEAGEQVLKAQTAEAKLTELAGLLKDDKLDLEHLSQISEQKDLKTPVLAELFASQHSTNSNPENAVNKGVENTLFAEISAQMQEMLKEENNKLAANKQSSQVDLNNSDLFSLNSDSVLEVDFGSQELANKNQNNFLELDNSNLNFNFELENQNTANNLKLDNFSLDSENKSQLAENTDLRSQVVEQFRGQYSPETKEMQIQLKPESLGKIDISLAYDNEKLTGKMLVESEIVRAQLENSLKGLKSDLLKQGINIEQFKIETAKNSPQQVEKQQEFAFNDQNSAFSDGETGQNQEFEQRQFFQGQYYVQRQNGNSNLKQENIIMKQQEMINRAAFSNEKLNLLA